MKPNRFTKSLAANPYKDKHFFMHLNDFQNERFFESRQTGRVFNVMMVTRRQTLEASVLFEWRPVFKWNQRVNFLTGSLLIIHNMGGHTR